MEQPPVPIVFMDVPQISFLNVNGYSRVLLSQTSTLWSRSQSIFRRTTLETSLIYKQVVSDSDIEFWHRPCKRHKLWVHIPMWYHLQKKKILEVGMIISSISVPVINPVGGCMWLLPTASHRVLNGTLSTMMYFCTHTHRGRNDRVIFGLDKPLRT